MCLGFRRCAGPGRRRQNCIPFPPLIQGCVGLPYYIICIYIKLIRQRGNLQDAINANVVNNRHFPEQEMLRLFHGTCLAVRAMHEYRPATPKSAAEAAASGSGMTSGANGKAGQQHDDDDDERFPQAEGDAEGGYSYDRTSVPLVTKQKVEESDVVFDGDEELEQVTEHVKPGSEMVPYAHRDLKPG